MDEDIQKLIEEHTLYKEALEYIAFGKAVNPQGYALRIVRNQGTWEFHRQEVRY